jgi:tetratricopeptide (TPR) repeat protein
VRSTDLDGKAGQLAISFQLLLNGKTVMTKHHLRKISTLLICLGALAAVSTLAEIPTWIANLENDHVMNDVYYQKQPFMGQTADVPNPPQLAKEKLARLVASEPAKVERIKLLAEQEIKLLEFAAAEKHLQDFVAQSSDKVSALEELARFYESRLRVADQARTLEKIIALLPDDASATTALHERKRYQLYHAIIQLIDAAMLKEFKSIDYYQAIARAYPTESLAYREYIAQLMQSAMYKTATTALADYHSKFPDDDEYFILQQASLWEKMGQTGKAVALFDRKYHPLWNQNLISAYYSLLKRSGQYQRYTEKLAQTLRNDPTHFRAATRLFHAYKQDGKIAQAQAVLSDFRLIKDSLIASGAKTAAGKSIDWTAEELYGFGTLYHGLNNYNEAARFYYALYYKARALKTSVPPANAEESLYLLFNVLLAAQNRPTQLGAENLSYYKDVAQLDQSPGFLNGILSLVLNRTYPKEKFQDEELKGIAYFNRARAQQLLAVFAGEFPQSVHLPEMFYSAIKTYMAYGQYRLVIDSAWEFDRRFPQATSRGLVLLLAADAYAALGEQDNVWKTYEQALRILSERRKASAKPANSAPGYEQVLDLYVSSLTRAKKYLDVLALYRREIDRDPSQEKLYEKLAAYLEQNNLFEDEIKVYERALKQFNNKNWYHKVARWYLRRQMQAKFEELSWQVAKIFQGSELERYISDLVHAQSDKDVFYVQLLLFAHQRFPHNLAFVHSLRNYYASLRSPNWEAWEKLSREYYFMDDRIRASYLAYLSKRRRLKPEIEALAQTGASLNVVQRRFLADAKSWQCYYEESVPSYEALVSHYPSEPELVNRLADIKRSLGALRYEYYFQSAALRARLASVNPSDKETLIRVGETYADIEDYDNARKVWDKILKIRPADKALYLEAATVYWDYYLYDDALRVIDQARKAQRVATALAYEAGAIYEGKRDRARAVDEYLNGLSKAGDAKAQYRLAQLYRRGSWQKLIDATVRKRLDAKPNDVPLLSAYMSLLDQQDKTEALTRLLTEEIDRQKDASFITSAKNLAHRRGLYNLEEKALLRLVSLAAADGDRITARLSLAAFFESQKRMDAAAETYQSLYTEHPKSAGCIRELVDFYWRAEKHDDALRVLQTSAAVANEKYKKDFLFELATKQLKLARYAEAETTLKSLLAIDPMNMDYFNKLAEVYAGARDYKAMAEHYRSGLVLIGTSSLADDQKKQLTAQFRQGIIRAQTILKDYTAAIDQYIEVINRDPENLNVLAESAEFARQHGQQPRLVAYYQRTAAASPKDYRWPLVLARLFTHFEQWAEVIEEYKKAIQIKPDRVSFYESLADTHRKLLDYDAASAVYQNLYDLTYKDPQWMLRMAELYARQGKRPETVAALEKAVATDKPLSASRYFEIGARLADWGFLPEAERFLETGFDRFEKNILEETISEAGLKSYLEVEVKLKNFAKGYRRLMSLRLGLQKKAMGATFEAKKLATHLSPVNHALTYLLSNALWNYASEPERSAAEQLLLDDMAQRGGVPALGGEIDGFYLPFFRVAHMALAEEKMLHALVDFYYGQKRDQYEGRLQALIQFYQPRHAFALLANLLEKESSRSQRPYDLITLASAYRRLEDGERELGALRRYYNLRLSSYDYNAVERYLELARQLGKQDELRMLASTTPHDGLQIINFFIRKGDKDLAVSALTAWERAKPAVWSKINRGMIGWYFKDAAPEFENSFVQGLGLTPIGAELAQAVDRQEALAGETWFYYGRKFGEYQFYVQPTRKPELHLVARLEGAPLSAENQADLGDFYAQARQLDRAWPFYQAAVELQPSASRYLDKLAEHLMAMGRRAEAVATWQRIVSVRDRSGKESGPSLGHIPAGDVALVVKVAAKHNFFADVRPVVEAYVREKAARADFYPAAMADLLEATVHAYATSAERVDFVRSLMRASFNPIGCANFVLQHKLLSAPEEEVLYQVGADDLAQKVAQAQGNRKRSETTSLVDWLGRFATYLIDTKQYEKAEAVLRKAQEQELHNVPATRLLHLQAKLALRKGDLDWARRKLEEDYRSADSGAINKKKYLDAYNLLKEERQLRAAQEVLIEMYQALLNARQFEDANFLGLAEALIERGNISEGIATLQRMVRWRGDQAETYQAAVDLLMRSKQFAAAESFANALTKMAPQDVTNSMRLAELAWAQNQHSRALSDLKTVLSSPLASNQIKAEAAELYSKVTSKEANAPPARTEPVESLPVLQKAWFFSPDDNNLRVKLFYAYYRAQKYWLATELFDAPIKQQAASRGVDNVSEPSENEENLDAEEAPEADAASPMGRSRMVRKPRQAEFLPAYELTPSEKLDLAVKLAESWEALGDLQRAIRFLDTAKGLADEAAKLKLDQKTNSLTAEQERIRIAEAKILRINENLGEGARPRSR